MEKLVHTTSFHSAHSSMANVYDNNVYKAQTCTSFYYSTDKWIGQWQCGSTPKNELPDAIQSLEWYTFLHYRVSQSRGSTRQPPFTTHFRIFKFRVCLIVYATKLNLFEILLYIKFIATKIFRSTVCLNQQAPFRD